MNVKYILMILGMIVMSILVTATTITDNSVKVGLSTLNTSNFNLYLTANSQWGSGAYPFKINLGYPDTIFGTVFTIRPYTPTTGALILKQFDETQSVNLMEIQDKDGNNINFAIGGNGAIVTNIAINKSNPALTLSDTQTGGNTTQLVQTKDQFSIYSPGNSQNIQTWNQTNQYTQLNGWMKIVSSTANHNAALTITQSRPWDTLNMVNSNIMNTIAITQTGTISTNHAVINIYDNVAQNVSDLAHIYSRIDNSGSNITNIMLNNDGNASLIILQKNITSKVCNTYNEGGLYYDGGTHKFYGCNSTTWNELG